MISCTDENSDKLMAMSVITNGFIQTKEFFEMSDYMKQHKAVPFVEWSPSGNIKYTHLLRCVVLCCDVLYLCMFELGLCLQYVSTLMQARHTYTHTVHTHMHVQRITVFKECTTITDLLRG